MGNEILCNGNFRKLACKLGGEISTKKEVQQQQGSHALQKNAFRTRVAADQGPYASVKQTKIRCKSRVFSSMLIFLFSDGQRIRAADLGLYF